jgi:hypothetical protein
MVLVLCKFQFITKARWITDISKCQCGQGPSVCGGVDDTCLLCSHTRCDYCMLEQHKLSEVAEEHLDG